VKGPLQIGNSFSRIAVGSQGDDSAQVGAGADGG
jgi:hypothetical protein